MSENNDTHKVLIKALKLKMIEIAKLGVESPKVDSNVRESTIEKNSWKRGKIITFELLNYILNQNGTLYMTRVLGSHYHHESGGEYGGGSTIGASFGGSALLRDLSGLAPVLWFLSC